MALRFKFACYQVIFAQKSLWDLSKTTDNDGQTIEDEVLKAWIVARACSSEYVIARSALSFSAATILSFLVWSSVIGWLLQGPTVKTHSPSDKLKFTVTILQVIFILIGWAIMVWRCAGYHEKWHLGYRETIWRVEDYWTRHIRDLIEDRGPKVPRAESLDRIVSKLHAKQPKKTQMSQMVYYVPTMLLYVMEVLQWTTVIFSKICWVVSLIIFHNKYSYKLLASILLWKHDKNELEKFSNDKNFYKVLYMMGDTPKSFWVNNKMYVTKAKEVIRQGNLDGQGCEELVTFLKRWKTSDGIDLSSFDSEKLLQFEYLWNSDARYKPLEVEEQFLEATKTSWKMTAVSLIRIIIDLSLICNRSECPGTCKPSSHDFPPEEMKDSLNAYFQAWEILDFVDSQDVDGIMAKAADTFFLTLQTKVEKGDLLRNRIVHSEPGCVATAINDITKESEEKAGKDQESVAACDSMNWKDVAVGIALYKLCKSIGNSPNARRLLIELQRALADVIYGSVIKAQSTLVLNSRKWASDNDEDKIGRALYTAGKTKALMEMMKDEINPPNSDCLGVITSTS